MFSILLFYLNFLTNILVYSAYYEKYYKEAYKIAQSMSLDQKIGQTIQTDFYALTENGTSSKDIGLKYHIGSVYNSGVGCADTQGNMVNLTNLSDQQLQIVYSKADINSWKKLMENCDYEETIVTKQGIRYRIKPFLGTNAMHGDQHVAGNIVFPHNIGLSCSHNEQIFNKMGFWTAKSMNRYKFNFVLAPTVAVSHNPQWGRFYQSMGQQTQNIQKYSQAFISGLQGNQTHPTGITTCTKHFFADGATFWGADQGNCQVENFTTFISQNIKGYRGGIMKGLGSIMVSYSAINFMPLAAGSFLYNILRKELQYDGFILSDNNHIRKLSSQTLPTSFERMGRNESVISMLAAGIDMQMIPPRDEMIQYFDYVKQGINKGYITIQRLNDAVSRILSVKLAAGFVRKISHDLQTCTNKSSEQLQEQKQDQLQKQTNEQYLDSLKAVHESLVLLKNQDILPLNINKIKYVVLVGQKIINIRNQGIFRLFRNYDNIGMQCGGWTFQFQGFNGNTIWSGKNKLTSNASSILDALQDIKNTLKQNQKFQILSSQYKNLTDLDRIKEERQAFLQNIKKLSPFMNRQNTVILAVIGESPYAQMVGDVNIPYCQNPTLYNNKGCIFYRGAYLEKQPDSLEIQFNEFEEKVISAVKGGQNGKIPLVTVLISGRPMIINNLLQRSDSFISAFLPGTSGGNGILQSITGKYLFRSDNDNPNVNSLSFDWPMNMQSLQNFPYYDSSGQVPKIANPLFKIGYGLSTKKKQIN